MSINMNTKLILSKFIIRKILFVFTFGMMISCNQKSEADLEFIDYTKFVNPFIGTDGTGHTFPGPTMPFGMVQPGPDNTDIGWDYTSGYQLQDSTILGFSNTRASGTGISEFGDVLLFPFVDNETTLSSKKIKENASVGYYSVALANKVKVALTATERVALHQYTFPTNKAKVFLNLQHGLRFLTDSLVLDSKVTLLKDKKTITGYCHTKNWVSRKYFFKLVFEESYTSFKELPKAPKENAPKYIFDFNLSHKKLNVKIAFSTVSVLGAANNLAAEMPHWNFELVKKNAQKTWNTYLNKIAIEASRKQKTIFYTAMYHLFIQPSNIADVDGKYRGADDKIAVATDKQYYSTLSLWDTFRAAHPLYTILVPERVNGFVNTMLLHHKAQGYLTIWTAWGQENHCMIGNHAIPVITDAFVKGFSGFDAGEALKAMVSSTTKNHLNSNWDVYTKYGYYPYDYIDNESVSRTLESGFDDYAVSLMSKLMGKDSVTEYYSKRASYYKNLFDSSTGLMRGKNKKGEFRTPFDPLTPTSPMNNPGDYTEANAWQYCWTPSLYDVEGYIELLGGKEKFTEQLDLFFSIKSDKDNKHLGQEGLIGQYAHGNEPSHHIAYLYAYSNKPEKGKDLLTQIYNTFYNDTPKGITGNDDCGQMSAWYIFTTLGFYPVNPANGKFVLGKPQVKKAQLNLKNATVLKIENHSDTFDKTVLNDALLSKEISYKSLMQGGTLQFKK